MKLIFGALLLSCTSVAIASAGIQTYPTNAAGSYAKTKYPVVFAHGMTGFTRIGTQSIGLDYWYKILPDLAKNGATVYATQASALNYDEVRGEQTIKQIEEIIAITGKPKVNLIGHSQGAGTIRYVNGVKPNLVASLTTTHGAVKGAKLADFGRKTGLDSLLAKPLLDVFLGPIVNFAQGTNLPVNAMGSIISLSSEGANASNAKYPQGVPTTACGEGAYDINGKKFYSWSGTGVFTNFLDPDSYIVSAFSLVTGSPVGDGLVDRCQSHFGKVIRDNYPHNHFDAVNQILGMRGAFSPDPVSIYREQANRLKNDGL